MALTVVTNRTLMNIVNQRILANGGKIMIQELQTIYDDFPSILPTFYSLLYLYAFPPTGELGII
ncbi:hypothetical protein TRIATDRAFT_258750 [Trichoderma atroviride IMI 206040]|uniref:Uncharacterized protein n=1 Tax=Hypocrea atroviridis (strain ATCC 20476 / IMI 206040) TaxID=452589 RepID=G9P644_HYPAI|nr:uncharacterized protein TRIATDRAFT_258750 [Trichoderma atroviride IMI 206040]EHK40595.1 hypothetical protein TRIATDRAFT_258750 [Trichoderma atroviride IMI 206040]